MTLPHRALHTGRAVRAVGALGPAGVLRRGGGDRPGARTGGFPLAAVLAVASLVAACGPSGGPSPTVARNEVLARTFMATWEAGNADAVADLFYPDAVYDDFPNETQYRGIEEIAGYIQHVHDWATGINVDVTAVHASETGAVAEWVFSGIQDKPIGTRVPVATGREVVVNGVTILEIDRGRIRRAADYMDQLPLMLQLGGEVRLPGGGVIRQDATPLPNDSTGGS